MSKPNLNLRFYLDKTEQQIRVEDSTDYSSLGIPLNEVFLALEIRTPAGLLYINPNYNIPSDTPDITGNIHIFTYTIPLVDNMLMRGVYTVNVNGLFNKANYKYSFSQVVDFGCKKPKIKHDIDCFCAKFKSTDITDYTGSTELTYEHIINYPSETNEPDITTIFLEWSDNKLANGTYVSEVRTKREWSFGNGFYVIDEIYGKQDIKVKCECLCDIKCAFNSLWEKYQQNCGVNKPKADELLIKINKATTLLTLINANTKCGEVEKTDTYLSQIKDLLGECDCGCGGGCEDEQIWVSQVCGSSGGSGSPFNYIFNSCNSLINVNTTIHENGQTKVVTICLNEQTINSLISNQFSILIEPILTALNLSWFNGLNTDCFGNFPDNGTEEEKKQYILDLLCLLKATVLSPPVARQDFSSTPFETSVQNLVTLNDFFNSDVTVTIVTPPLNGVCTVLADGKTLKYTPNNGFSGIDAIIYQITDASGQTSSSTWTVTVNTQLSASCSTVTPAYNADIYSVGASLQLAISNQSSMGTNTISAVQYIVEIRDSSNVILHSYTVTGSSNVNPTIFTTPIPIVSTWDNVRIQMLLTTQSATGQPCGTVTYETPTPYSLTDVSISWFDGTTIPVCLGILPTDTETQKKNKLMTAICDTATIVDEHTTTIDAQQTIIDSLIDQLNSLTDQVNYATVHLFDCCGAPAPSDSFDGTKVELCTEPTQGRITYIITYLGVTGITNIVVLQKALLVPTATPNTTISSTGTNMIVPGSLDMRTEIADIGNVNNKFRLLVQYEESAIVKQGYLVFDLPHFQLTDNLCVANINATFQPLFA